MFGEYEYVFRFLIDYGPIVKLSKIDLVPTCQQNAVVILPISSLSLSQYTYTSIYKYRTIYLSL